MKTKYLLSNTPLGRWPGEFMLDLETATVALLESLSGGFGGGLGRGIRSGGSEGVVALIL